MVQTILLMMLWHENVAICLKRRVWQLYIEFKNWTTVWRFVWAGGWGRGGARGVPGGVTAPSKFCLVPPVAPPKFSAWRHVTALKSYTDHWQLPLLQNWPFQWPPQMKMSGSAPVYKLFQKMVSQPTWNKPDKGVDSEQMALSRHYTMFCAMES